jgi:hypothetical protein
MEFCKENQLPCPSFTDDEEQDKNLAKAFVVSLQELLRSQESSFSEKKV